MFEVCCASLGVFCYQHILILLLVIVFPMRVRELLLKQHVHKIEVTYDILSDVCGRLKA